MRSLLGSRPAEGGVGRAATSPGCAFDGRSDVAQGVPHLGQVGATERASTDAVAHAVGGNRSDGVNILVPQPGKSRGWQAIEIGTRHASAKLSKAEKSKDDSTSRLGRPDKAQSCEAKDNDRNSGGWAVHSFSFNFANLSL